MSLGTIPFRFKMRYKLPTMRTRMINLNKLVIGLSLALLAAGCDVNSDRSAYFEAPAANATPNPGGAPVYGVPSGMGFYTGDAAQTGGMGTGLMSFHGTGSAGTSGTLTDIRTSPPLATGLRPG
jgi:hypothetical protein